MMINTVTTPVGHDRLQTAVSLVSGVKSQRIEGFDTLGNIFDAIQDKKNAKLQNFTHALHSALEQSKTAYDKLKTNRAPGFIIGNFTERDDKGVKDYFPLLGFDIDALESYPLALLTLDQLKTCPQVYAAFPSPSKKGLRAFMWCETTPEQHSRLYDQFATFLGQAIGVPTDKQLRKTWRKEGVSAKEIRQRMKETAHVDTSTKNISRIWFYTSIDPEDFYINHYSEVLSLSERPSSALEDSPIPDPALGLPRQNVKRVQKIKPSTEPEVTLSENEKVEICKLMAEQRDIPAGRNNYVHAMSKILFEHGISESRILSEMVQLVEPDFTEQEVHSTVASALKNVQVKYSDEQLLHWRNKVKGEKPKHVNGSHQSEGKNGYLNNEEYEQLNKFQKIKLFLSRRYEFRYNVISNKLEYREVKKKNSTFKGMDDDNAAVGEAALNENDIEIDLLEAGFSSVKELLKTLLMSSRFSPRYNPVQDYFDTLPAWDGHDHIDQLTSFVKTSDDAFFRHQFRKALVRSVACSLNWIPFNKHCLVLKGNQNDGKTSFIRFLCPPELQDYYTEQIDFSNKDGRIALAQNFIINLDEMANMAKYEIKQVKSFLTYDKIKERLPYGTTFKNFHRIANFFATTNESEFLTDSTGNVRWLIFEVQKINHGNGKGYSAQVDIQQVWAQAYQLLRDGFPVQLSKEEIELSEKNNHTYLQRTIEMELIQRSFLPAAEKDGEFLTATQILQAIEADTKQRINIVQVGKALSILGFEQKQKYVNGKSKKRYQAKGYYVQKISD